MSMFMKETCPGHKWHVAWHGGKVCDLCKQHETYIIRNAETARSLDAAEAEHGPFGTGKLLPDLVTGHSSLAFYILTDKEGKWVACHLDGPCYAQIKDNKERLRAAKAAYILDWPFSQPDDNRFGDWKAKEWRRCGGKTGWASKWYHWMANHSPWKDIILTKSWEKAWNESVLYSCDFPGEWVMAAMSGIRYIGETPDIPKAFVKATKLTDNPMEALLAAHCVELNGTEANSHMYDSGHSMWYLQYLNEPRLKNLFAGKLVRSHDKNFRESWYWHSCYKMFGLSRNDNDDEGYGFSSANFCKAFKLPETGAVKAQDIFGNTYYEEKKVNFKEWMQLFKEEASKWQPK